MTELIHKEVQRVIQILGSISGGKILDIATGEGDFINTLIKTIESYDTFTAIEISEKALEKAKKELKDIPVTFFQMNAENLEFQDNEFDTVCISHSLHHLENIDKVLSEMLRVLKPNGYFILQEAYSDGEQTEAQMTEIQIHHWSASIDRKRGITHNETLTKNEINSYIDKLHLTECQQFDIKHSIYCAFCKRLNECMNPKSEFIQQSTLDRINTILKKALDCEPANSKEYENKANKLRQRVKQYGDSNASALFFLGKKKG